MTAAESFFVGIDTGGTYTDAVIIAHGTQKVLGRAKALTTKGDLSIGVKEALTMVMQDLPSAVKPSAIGLVSVSTTLATNAVVEGHGSPVAVFLIGFDSAMASRTGIAKAFPHVPLRMIAGGHDHNGDASAPLDVASVEREAALLRGEVSAFAVASAFAVRNPEHENLARDIIMRVTGKPVTLSTELTSSLDAPRRALTAVLNARLISRISLLIDAVRLAMAHLDISCPLMVVKGDGSLARAENVALKPIETVLSGPAASLVGAKWLSGLNDFIMSDIGGTTTDIGILQNGRPQVAEEGAEVGGWRTMVKAIDVTTIGLGGDSEVHLAMDGSMQIGPQRIVPISLIGARYPEVMAMLEGDLADTEGGSQQGRFVVAPFGRSAPADHSGLTAREIELLSKVTDRPKPLRKVAVSSGAQRALNTLRKKGLVQLCGFTPSDAAHVLGLQENWSKPAALLAAQLVVRFRDMRLGTPERVEAFCREVWSETVRLSAKAILASALGIPVENNPLIESVVSGSPVKGLAAITISPTIPIVAVGGPARVYYAEVAKRLECEVVFVEWCEVANAIGAAAGLVASKVMVMVEGDGNGAFRVHGAQGTRIFGSGTEALAFAETAAHDQAERIARGVGAVSPRVNVNTTKFYLPDAIDENGLLKAEITAEAVGRPSPA
ncbi:MAG: hydantoinase/oxoprolinase family protein [Hyphomicrobiales bacterium]|nr:hydantoinase/oxoprolinase family protein [Hyphomicrobiales bacterium]